MLPQPLFPSSSEPDHVSSRAGSPVAARRSQISAQVPPLVAGVAGADALADAVVAGDAMRAVDVVSSLRRWLCWVVGWGVGVGVLLLERRARF